MQGAGLISCKQPSLPTIVLLFHHLTCPSPIYTLCLAITNQLAQDRLSPPVPTRKVREHPSSIPNDPTCPHPDPITRLIAPTPSPSPSQIHHPPNGLATSGRLPAAPLLPPCTTPLTSSSPRSLRVSSWQMPSPEAGSVCLVPADRPGRVPPAPTLSPSSLLPLS
jgi:hypothetical protein